MRTISFVCLLLCCVACSSPENQTPYSPPNIIYILADDLGYGDLSRNGQRKFTTPYLDLMAGDGMIFTNHYSGSTVCAPSRSTLMTGQHTGHTFIRGNREIMPEGQYPLADSVMTVAEMLRTHGYVTGAFGKWGLGAPGTSGDPINQGFDRFFGYNCQRLAHSYYPYRLWNNQDTMWIKANQGQNKRIYAPDLIQQQLLLWLEEQKDTSFFAYVPMVIPHAELAVPDQYLKKYQGAFGEEVPYDGYDEGPKYREGPYASQAEPHATFASMVYYLDKQVGEIRQKIKELGLEDNTLIIFTSDNGPHHEGGADPDFFDSNGPYRGYKRDLYEGGIHVPMITSWPGTIQPGDTATELSAFWDMYTTFEELASGSTTTTTDGISLLPLLKGEESSDQHEYLYWEFYEKEGKRAIRKGSWKLIQLGMNGNPLPPELYNLETDPGEVINVADTHPGIVNELMLLMEEAHHPSSVFEWKARES